MKILAISNLYPPFVLGGYEILCEQVCDALRSRGHEVHVLTSGDKACPAERGIERSLWIETPFDKPSRRNRRRRRVVARHNARVTTDAIARLCPDRVFVWSQLRLSLGAALAAERSGVPVAYTLNDEHLTGYLPTKAGFSARRLAGWLADSVVAPDLTLRALRLRHTTCISSTLRANLVAGGVPVSDAEVIYQGIPLQRFPVDIRRGERRGRFALLYAGQLHAYKGVHTLLEAVGFLRNRLGSEALRVTIAGDGPAPYVAKLRQLAKDCGCPVSFTGRLEQAKLKDLYRSHDAFVFPSIWEEPFGLTHLEAMASGTPVVSTTRGGTAEFLEHGENSLVFEAGDAGELASRLEALSQDKRLLSRLAHAGRETVEQRFTLDRYVRDIECFLESAA